MTTWAEFRTLEPELAESGRGLFYQFGVGLGFLATIRKDGGPRVHPMCPILVDDRLFALLIPSPKQRDLIRDGRYAMHSYPRENDEDAFYVTGAARRIAEPDVRERVVSQFLKERKGLVAPESVTDQFLFEFEIETALLTRTTGHGDSSPQHRVWNSGNK
jgi:hypothetical protein